MRRLAVQIRSPALLEMAIIFCLFLVEVDSILKKTEDHYINLKSYYVEFVQTDCNKVDGTCQRYIGRVAYKAPDKLRLEIEGAENRTDLFDGEWLWTYLPDEGRLYKQKPTQPLFDLKSLIRDYRERFQCRLIRNTPPYEIEFRPRSGDEGMSKMKITISKHYLIKKIEIVDPMGNESIFQFNRFSLNKRLSDKIFKLRLPKDVEVIEQ